MKLYRLLVVSLFVLWVTFIGNSDVTAKVTNVSCSTGSGSGVDTAVGCIPTDNLNNTVGWFVSKAIYIASGAAFLFLVYGGFLLLTSSGDANKVKAGTELISAALSGLLFIIVSVLLFRIIGFDILQIPGFI